MTLAPLIDTMTAYAIYFVVAATAVALFWLLRAPPTDPREPPLKRSLIPGIGHGVGIFWYRSQYLEMLRAKYRLPIFMIPILRAKIVVVTSPDIMQSALRAKDLSFDPFTVKFAQTVIGSKTAHFAEASAISENEKEVNFNSEMHKTYHEPLAPGPDLQQTNQNALNRLSVLINEIGFEYTRQDLYEWLRDIFTISSTTSLYGSRNPLEKDHSLITALSDFDAGLQILMVDILPSITARKADKGRAKIQAAMREYFKAGYYNDDDVSVFIKKRQFINRKYGFSPEECGDFDLGMLLVATTNAVPTLYWFMVYIFSQPAVIASLRAEVNSIMKSSIDPITGISITTVEVSKINSYCPLLVSAYQETQRLCNKNMSIRVALQDTTISSPNEGAYLIKKNTIVFLPSAMFTTASEVWGPDAESFVATRFLNRDKEKEKIQKKTYFPFGGGKHYCPGRHFAFAEILGFIAVMCTGFEVVMADGPNAGGPIQVPERRERYFAEAVPKPVGKLKVLIRRRMGFESVKWKFDASDVET